MIASVFAFKAVMFEAVALKNVLSATDPRSDPAPIFPEAVKDMKKNPLLISVDDTETDTSVAAVVPDETFAPIM